jgi:hypothetical protein
LISPKDDHKRNQNLKLSLNISFQTAFSKSNTQKIVCTAKKENGIQSIQLYPFDPFFKKNLSRLLKMSFFIFLTSP